MAEKKFVQFRRGTLEEYNDAVATNKCDGNDIYVVGDSSEVSDPNNPLRIYVGDTTVHTVSTEDITVANTTFDVGTSLEKIIKELALLSTDSLVPWGKIQPDSE